MKKYIGYIVAVAGLISAFYVIGDFPYRPTVKMETDQLAADFRKFRQKQQYREAQDSYYKAKRYRRNPKLDAKDREELDNEIKYYRGRVNELRKKIGR